MLLLPDRLPWQVAVVAICALAIAAWMPIAGILSLFL